GVEPEAEVGRGDGPLARRPRLARLSGGTSARARGRAWVGGGAGHEAEMRAVQLAEHELDDGGERLQVGRGRRHVDIFAADRVPVTVPQAFVVPAVAHRPPAEVEAGPIPPGDVEQLQGAESVRRLL